MNQGNGCIVHPANAEANGRLLSINEIKKNTGLSRKFIAKQIKLSKLPAVRFSPRAIRIDARDLEAFIAGRKTATTAGNGGAA